MHLQNCRCFQEHLRMLLQSLRALCFAPGGAGSIWNYLGAPVRSTGVSGRFACGFRTDLHFADVPPVETGLLDQSAPPLWCWNTSDRTTGGVSRPVERFVGSFRQANLGTVAEMEWKPITKLKLTQITQYRSAHHTTSRHVMKQMFRRTLTRRLAVVEFSPLEASSPDQVYSWERMMVHLASA